MGISLEDIALRFEELNHDNDLVDDTDADSARSALFYKLTELTWRAVMDNNHIAGYWSFALINQEVKKRVSSGVYRESDLSHLTIQLSPLSHSSDLLFDCVCLDKPYQGKKLTHLIFISMLESLSSLPERNISIETVWASVWSESGQRFVEKIGFEYHGSNYYRGEIYKTKFSRLLFHLRKVADIYSR